MARRAPSPAYVDDLSATHEEAWRLLAQGAADRRSAFHTPVIATLGPDGRARLRTVVLRAVDRATGTLRFHTDRRSEKVAEIDRDNRIALHGYDPGSKIQIRIDGRAAVHMDDDIAKAAWTSSQRMSRVCYGTAPAPGTSIASGGDFTLPQNDAEIAAGEDHFAVVVLTLSSLEWLFLDHAGHRRARFMADGSGQWLSP